VCKVNFQLERNAPAPTHDQWKTETGEHRAQITGVFILEDGWACTLWLVYYSDVWEVGGLTIHPAQDAVAIGPARRGPNGTVHPLKLTLDVAEAATDPPSGAVTSRLLRELPIGKMAEELRRYLREHPTVKRRSVSLASQLDMQPGRRGRPDSFYAQVAAAYVSILEDEPSAAPVKVLAEREGYSRSMVNNWLRQARNRELLTEARPGKAGGSLTDKGRAALEEGDNQ
jgi:hypothetical protein